MGNLTPLTPTYLTLSNGYNVPALTYGTAAKTFTAADADGDGIADSLLFRIPGLNLDGLTWYAGVRIIDNNSAINANTAWSRDTESFYSGAAATNTWGLFPTSVGLQDMLNASDNIATLNAYRFGNNANAGQDPYDESPIGVNSTTAGNSTMANIPPQAFGRGTNAGDTADYSFISQSEAFYQQFIRRIANPGYNTYGGGTGTRYQALPLADEAALAYHFCLQNPNSLSQSVVESLLPNSLCGTSGSPVPSTPYDPSQVNTANGWYPTNFKYTALAGDAVTAPMSLLRPARHPQSRLELHPTGLQ